MKKLVLFGAAGLKLGRDILKTLESIDVSISILAAQKERELNPDPASSLGPDAK